MRDTSGAFTSGERTLAQATAGPLGLGLTSSGSYTVRGVRRPIHLLALVGLAAIVAGCGSGSAFSPALPQRVQRAIVKTFPLLAYVPTELPAGYHYSEYFSSSQDDFGLSFTRPGGTPDDLGFRVRNAHCPGGALHTFRVSGVRIRWGGTYEDQEAWRCFTRDHVPVIVSASRSIFGDDSLNTPKRFHDALELARLVANVEHIR